MAAEVAARWSAGAAGGRPAGRSRRDEPATPWTRGKRGSLAATFVAGTLAWAAVGCGALPHLAGSGAPSPLAFSQCMRSHGVRGFPDAADGVFNVNRNKAGSMTVNGLPMQATQAQIQAAGRACAHLLGESAGNGPPSPAAQQAANAFGACMRAHGLANYPDPQVTAHGYSMAQPVGNNPQAAAFQSALQACQSVDPALVQAAQGNGQG